MKIQEKLIDFMGLLALLLSAAPSLSPIPQIAVVLEVAYVLFAVVMAYLSYSGWNGVHGATAVVFCLGYTVPSILGLGCIACIIRLTQREREIPFRQLDALHEKLTWRAGLVSIAYMVVPAAVFLETGADVNELTPQNLPDHVATFTMAHFALWVAQASLSVPYHIKYLVTHAECVRWRTAKDWMTGAVILAAIVGPVLLYIYPSEQAYTGEVLAHMYFMSCGKAAQLTNLFIRHSLVTTEQMIMGPRSPDSTAEEAAPILSTAAAGDIELMELNTNRAVRNRWGDGAGSTGSSRIVVDLEEPPMPLENEEWAASGGEIQMIGITREGHPPSGLRRSDSRRGHQFQQ